MAPRNERSDGETPHHTEFRGLSRLALVGTHELLPLLASCGLTFITFTALFSMRPVRDAIQSEQHLETELPWVVTATLITMTVASFLFSAIASRLPRRLILPATLELITLSALAFFILFRTTGGEVAAWSSKAFYVWYSVVNLLAVSSVWSVLADAFSTDQARRLFGKISIGSTLGVISGSALASLLAARIGSTWLLLIAAALLQIAVIFGWYMSGRPSQRTIAVAESKSGPAGAALGGGVLDGVRALLGQPYLLFIAGYVLLYTVTSTFLSLQQNRLMTVLFDPTKIPNARDLKTQFSANMSLTANIIVLVTQLFLAAHVVRWLGISRTLLVTPLITIGGFILLAWRESAGTLLVAYVARSSMHYAIDRPSREALYSPLPSDLKYKAKNLIDTVMYRGGDALTTWWTAFVPAGLAFTASTLAAAVAWFALAFPLGRLYNRQGAEKAK